ncbi:hypothetical protein B7P43_G08105 [Cryptotermes secundus]|uniref:Uncharacterized protein n=1 Tax=Cryptotermes secundus TaxID=105785 RepID=A0A2J7Q651_9NEOP|nr:hypothetical protein B7P43_G08105 [Cryptotermes secundus]
MDGPEPPEPRTVHLSLRIESYMREPITGITGIQRRSASVGRPILAVTAQDASFAHFPKTGIFKVNPQNKNQFYGISPERGFADFIFAHIILHIVVMNFIG